MRRPRFSLLSLVLFTLLVGSGVALWLHWPAWRVVATLGGSHVDYRIDSSRSLILVRDQVGDYHDLFDSNGIRIQHFAADAVAESGMFSEQGACIEFKPIDKSKPIRLWRIASQRWEDVPRKIEPTRFTADDAEQYSQDGRWVLAKKEAAETRRFRIFDVSTGKEVVSKAFKTGDEAPYVFIYGLGLNRDALGFQYPDRIEIRAPDSLKLIATHSPDVSAQFSSNGRWMACGHWRENLIKVYDLNTGELRHTLSHPPGTGMFDNSVLVRFSPDAGELYAMDAGFNFAVKWSMADIHRTEFELAKAEKANRVTMGVNFSKDGVRIDAWDQHYKFGWMASWDRRTGALIYKGTYSAMTHDAAPLRLIDSDGNLLAPPATQPLATFKGDDNFEFLADRERILVHSESDGLKIYGRQRPETWWGVTWLPEFWSTVAFAGLFVWNLRRRRFSR